MIKYFLAIFPFSLLCFSFCQAESGANLGPTQYPEYVQVDTNSETESVENAFVADFSSLS